VDIDRTYVQVPPPTHTVTSSGWACTADHPTAHMLQHQPEVVSTSPLVSVSGCVRPGTSSAPDQRMTAANTFRKALSQLDHDQLEKGEASLRSAITEATAELDEVTRVGATTCLGDLLFELGRLEEARPLLEAIAAFERDDEVLDWEIQRARELLEIYLDDEDEDDDEVDHDQ
jgi:hypothetical protein